MTHCFHVASQVRGVAVNPLHNDAPERTYSVFLSLLSDGQEELSVSSRWTLRRLFEAITEQSGVLYLLLRTTIAFVAHVTHDVAGISSTRVIHQGKILTDSSTTLWEAGIRENAQLSVVAKLGGVPASVRLHDILQHHLHHSLKSIFVVWSSAVVRESGNRKASASQPACDWCTFKFESAAVVLLDCELTD